MAFIGKCVLWLLCILAATFLLLAYKHTLWGFQYWPFFVGMLVGGLARSAIFRD